MRRITDEQGYAEKLVRQAGPGTYFGLRPTPEHLTVLPTNPYIHPQGTAVPVSSTLPPVVIESDLRGLGRPLGREANSAVRKQLSTGLQRTHHYWATTPIQFENTHNTPLKQVMEFVSSGKHAGIVSPAEYPDLNTSASRLDLPAPGFRGKYPDRFESALFQQPVDIPFEREVSSRIIMKDQWRVPKDCLSKVAPPTIPGLIR